MLSHFRETREKEEKVIEIYEKNPNTPYGVVAEQLGVSSVTILQTIKKLKDLGFLEDCHYGGQRKGSHKISNYILLIRAKEDRIVEILKADPMKDFSEISKEINLPLSTLYQTINRMKIKGKLEKKRYGSPRRV